MKKTIVTLFAISIFIPNATHADITTGLVDWWKVDEGTGTTGADSGSNNLTLTTDGTWLSPGKINASSMQFNGSSQSASAGNSGAGNAYTISAWVKKTGSGSSDPRGIFLGSGDNYIDLCFSGGPMFSFAPSISGQTIISPGTGCAPQDEWHLYTATWDGATHTATLYYDGSSIGSDNSTSGSTIFSSVTLAQYFSGGLFLNGAMDDMRIYNRALTSGDVSELYLYNGASSFSRSITVNTGQASGTQTNFPMFFGGTYDGTGGEPDLRTVGNGGKVQNPNGYDVGFYSNSNCSTGKLDWEIEKYTATTGVVAYWVEVPSLLDGAVIYLCYGDTSISTNQSNGTGVWDSSYKAVWHLGNNASLSVEDSTSNNNDAVNAGGVTAIAGKLGTAGEFDNTDGTDKMTTSYTPTGTNITMEAWLNNTGNFPGGEGHALEYNPLQIFVDNTPALRFYSGSAYTATAPSITQGVWTHTVLVGNGTGHFMYKNGALASESGNTSVLSAAAGPVVIGDFYGAGFKWYGELDELRVSETARSASYISTEYNNQTAPDTFYAIGTEQSGTIALVYPNPNIVVEKGIIKIEKGVIKIGK